MVAIIVRGGTPKRNGYVSTSKAKHFRAHYNEALGKFVSTKEEYKSDMKRMGLEPFDPSTVKKVEPKPYELSKWGKDMINAGIGKEEIAKKNQEGPNAAS
jgi:hypothetical protein